MISSLDEWAFEGKSKSIDAADETEVTDGRCSSMVVSLRGIRVKSTAFREEETNLRQVD